MRATLLALAACVSHLALASSTVRNPLQFIAALEDPVIRTAAAHRVHAHSSFDLDFDLYDHSQHVRLTLEPNDDVLQPGAYVERVAADGSVYREELERHKYKVFRGVARVKIGSGWSQVGWARVSMLRDGRHPLFEGAFTVYGDGHHIQLDTNYRLTKLAGDPDVEVLPNDERMIVWRDSDAVATQREDLRKRSLLTDRTCLADNLEFNANPDHPVYRMMRREETRWGRMSNSQLFGKRQSIDGQTGGNTAGVNLVSTIGQTDGCPKSRKVALVGVAADCGYVGGFNGNDTAFHAYVIAQMNQASAVWESAFNISLGMTALKPMPSECPTMTQDATPWNRDCNSGLDITARLNLFAGWRGQQSDGNSHWTLLTSCNSGAAVGLAWLGQACVQTAQTSGNETISGANVVARTPSEWQVIAHETGHTFGAVHDCDSQTCQDVAYVRSQQCCQLSSSQCDANGAYIMNPSTSEQANSFSLCTIGNICSGIGRNAINTTCLSDNKNVKTIQGQQCGNGIVEDGEECDCGGESGCADNNCCDATTCKFKGSAVCDDSNEDCCRSCQFATAGTVCRPSTSSCDPQETCPGNSAICPTDVTAPDGQSCSAGNSTTGDLQCASGQCTSRNLQCRTVMSAYISGANDTYACDSQSCSLTCASPAFGPNMCYSLQQNFLDGTPCGGGGHCTNGQCQGSTVGGQIKSWIDDHKALVIGIASAIGGLILLAILSCIWSSCRRRRSRKRQKLRSPPPSQLMPGSLLAQQQQMTMAGANRQPQHGIYEYYSHNNNNNIPPPPPIFPAQAANPRSPYEPASDHGHDADPFQQHELWQRAQQASYNSGWRPPMPQRDSSFRVQDLSMHSDALGRYGNRDESPARSMRGAAHGFEPPMGPPPSAYR